jgi:hypothetical protein
MRMFDSPPKPPIAPVMARAFAIVCVVYALTVSTMMGALVALGRPVLPADTLLGVAVQGVAGAFVVSMIQGVWQWRRNIAPEQRRRRRRRRVAY